LISAPQMQNLWSPLNQIDRQPEIARRRSLRVFIAEVIVCMQA